MRTLTPQSFPALSSNETECLGGVTGGVEGEGLGEDAAEAVLYFGLYEVGEENAVGAPCGGGEGGVGFTEAGKIGVERDGVADVADDEEGGVVVGEGADVGLGLAARLGHGGIPCGGVADAVAFFGGGAGSGDGGEEWVGLIGFGGNALLSFEDEVVFCRCRCSRWRWSCLWRGR